MIQFKIKISAMLVVIMLLLTSIIATAAEKVSTVDAKELFTAKNFITDEPETVSKDITKQVMEDVSANMAKQRAILHWDAVSSNSAKMDIIDNETILKATPIIITAADIDAQKKAKKQSKQEINSVPDNSFSQVKLPVIPKKETVLPAAKSKPAALNKVNNSKAESTENYTKDTVSLPPIQSVKQAKEEIVALPPIEAVAAEKVVALPPVHKIS